jgi:aminoglycoside phosphotransferase (APT) family kinase protein
MTQLDPALVAFARGRVSAVLGAAETSLQVQPLQARTAEAVLLVTLPERERQVVLKVAGGADRTAPDFARTAAVMSLARAAGAPVAAVLDVDTSARAGPWRYLMVDHVAGLEWHRIRPRLDPSQLDAAHREIAESVLAVQSVRFDSFGELDSAGRPDPADLVTSLRQRAELRISSEPRRELFRHVLERHRDLFEPPVAPTVCHDDLHHANVVFRPRHGGWQLAGLLDWDKAWAGPPESDVARMAFWDDMTGPAFWDVYRAAVPQAPGWSERALVYQLLWCLEYEVGTPRHRDDTARLCRRLGVRPVL